MNIYTRLNSFAFHRARALRYKIAYLYRSQGQTMACLTRDAGFSLVEVMFALALGGVLIVTLLIFMKFTWPILGIFGAAAHCLDTLIACAS